jgi:hypothetical protein
MSTLSISEVRAQADLLANQLSSLSSHYLSLQRESHSCTNHCHDAWSKASAANFDSPSISQNFHGFLVRQALMESTVAHSRLHAALTQARLKVQTVHAEVLALYNRVVGIHTSAAAGLAAALLQAARPDLDFEVDPLMQQAQAFVARAGYHNQWVEADSPGQDVGPYARAVMADADQAKYQYGAIATAAGQKALFALDRALAIRVASASLN